MKKPYTHLLVACLVVMAMQCRTKTPIPTNPINQLPPATQTGENTFGCLVNGEAFVVTNTSKKVAIFQQGQLQFFWGGEIDNINKDISFNLVDPLEEGINYKLFTKNSNPYFSGYSEENGNVICNYLFEDTYDGVITFSNIDRTKFIISGTFEFSTATTDCDTIHITDGRFDMQYIP